MEIRSSDLHTLVGIVQGQGCYATPSPNRVRRLQEQGLIKKRGGGRLKPTIKGRFVALMRRGELKPAGLA